MPLTVRPLTAQDIEAALPQLGALRIRVFRDWPYLYQGSEAYERDYVRAFARLENHFFQNAGFLECDGWILRERHRIQHIPATIIQGRYDMICPPHSAWSLAQGWSKCELKMVPMAGHALSEPGISEALVRVMDSLRA